ncbi:OmpA family protein [Marilutibacter aestuarii]|uniref:OmpA family protein n=1 Tax=Marilutibacter aestuarii TaxID=1706195 RepID=A0A508AID8_9GAMM|nr:OmpA family protein [Lysobacter aestuarii]TQD48224.1 OmpA family protein [Lysobacter aestuarii]
MPQASPHRPRYASARVHWAPCLLLASLALAGCDRGATPEANTPAPAATSAAEEEVDDAVASALPPPSSERASSLNITNNSGAIRYDGRVDSAAHRDAIDRAFANTFPSGQASGSLAVDPEAKAPAWVDGLDAFLAGFNVSGTGLRFDGNRIELTGKVDPDTRARLTDAAREHFPDAELGGLFIGAADDPALAALAALGADASVSELEGTLNTMTVAFEPDSAKLSASSLAVLAQAGQTIAAMPRDRQVEIVGNASASDDPAFDERLALQRAEAVKVQLIVNGVGPGQIRTSAHLGDAGDGPAPGDSVGFRVAD